MESNKGIFRGSFRPFSQEGLSDTGTQPDCITVSYQVEEWKSDFMWTYQISTFLHAKKIISIHIISIIEGRELFLEMPCVEEKITKEMFQKEMLPQ